MNPVSLVKKAACGMLAMGSTLLMAACYGPVRIYEIASGRVSVPEGTPRQYGTQVCARLNSGDSLCQPANDDGSYYLDTEITTFNDSARQEGFRLCAGDTAGLLAEQCVDIPPNSIPVHQDFTLEFLPNE